LRVKDINVNRSANVGKYVTFAIKTGDLASEMVEGFSMLHNLPKLG